MATPKKTQASGGGFKVERCGGKNKGRNLIFPAVANELIDRVNSLGAMSIVRTTDSKDAVVYSDANIIIKLGRNSQVGTGAAGVVKRAKITALNTDSLSCSLWDNLAEDFTGLSVEVAKPYELRSIASRAEWGVSWSYSYASGYQERTRTATGFAATKQRVFTPYAVNDEIFVVDTGEATGVTDCTYIDLNLDKRRWLTETKGCNDAGDPVYAFVDRSPWVDTAIGSNFD